MVNIYSINVIKEATLSVCRSKPGVLSVSYNDYKFGHLGAQKVTYSSVKKKKKKPIKHDEIS